MHNLSTTVIFASLVLAFLGCSNGTTATTVASAVQAAPAEPPVAVTTTAAPSTAAPSTIAASTASNDVCSADGVAGTRGQCVSPSCSEIPADMKRCNTDADCKVDSFATCECAFPGPFFSVNVQSHKAVRERFIGKYGGECSCGCREPVAACIQGTCGFKDR